MEGGIPILTITISAGGRPPMPPGHELGDGHPMEEHKEMAPPMDMGPKMDMKPEDADLAPPRQEKPRGMTGIKNFKPKRDSAPAARRM
jgi:hypothetical protein